MSKSQHSGISEPPLQNEIGSSSSDDSSRENIP